MNRSLPWAAKTGCLQDQRRAVIGPLPSTPSSRLPSSMASNRRPTSPMSSPRSLATGLPRAGMNSCLGTGSQISNRSPKPPDLRPPAHAYTIPINRQKGRFVRRRQQPSLPEQMAPLIDLASRHIVAPRDARQRLSVHSHSGDDLELLRVAPPTTPFPAQYLHRRPSLWLRTSITTSLWTSLTRSHHSKAGGLNRSVTEALP